jgi:hypothetical protein
MTTLTVNLPDKVKALAESRASAAGYADVSEYLARLIEAEASASSLDSESNSDDQLEALLLARVDDNGVEMDAADFQRLRKKLAT